MSPLQNHGVIATTKGTVVFSSRIPLSHQDTILGGDTLFISGMGGEDAAGKIPGVFEAEVKQALDNVGAVLKAGGMSPADVVSVQVYLTDAETFERMNAVYKAYFKEHVRPGLRL